MAAIKNKKNLMENIFAEIDKGLQQGRRMVLARIIRQVGSAPRGTGTKCLIMEDGTLKGTIGGGLLEYQVMEKAGEILEKGRSETLHFKLTGTELAKSEMLCGGLADVYMEPLSSDNPTTTDLFARLAALLAEGRSGVLITQIAEGRPHGDTAGRLLIAGDGTRTGAIEELSEDDLQRVLKKPAMALVKPGGSGRPVFVEPVRPDDVLYLFGAGHVSTQVAPLAALADFRVVVIDDRSDFASRERFPAADEVIVAPFVEVFERLAVNLSTYVVILTRGHTHDRDVLLKALEKPGAYIGMIGSRRKRDVIYRSLMENGISARQLEQVHSPIGLDIGAETPEEIAISIVAELIQVRAAQRSLTGGAG